MKRWLVIGMWMVACLSIAISLTVLISPVVYRLYAQQANLSDISGLTLQQLQANYNVMWQYVVNPFEQGFQFLNFDMSTGGAKHFAEVQRLISINSVATIVLGGILWGSLRKVNDNGQEWRSQTLVVMLGLPMLLMMFFATMFEQVFVLFHHILFRNELWLFDPSTDPIITVLPSGFFMILFILSAVVYEFLLFMIYKKIVSTQEKFGTYYYDSSYY